MTDIVLIFDAEGRCLKTAPTNPSLLDHLAAEFIGKTVYDLFLADQADRLLQHIHQALARRESISWIYHVCINHADVCFRTSIAHNRRS